MINKQQKNISEGDYSVQVLLQIGSETQRKIFEKDQARHSEWQIHHPQKFSTASPRERNYSQLSLLSSVKRKRRNLKHCFKGFTDNSAGNRKKTKSDSLNLIL